ncbi:MAG: Fe-S cluster assembly sulfur transfer protein SufU [Bacteroidota bacterium]
MDLKTLYQQTIRDYAKADRYYYKMDDAHESIEAYNPYCGDQFRLYLKWDGEAVESASFHGYGCAISKASTAILIEYIQGRSREEINQLIQQFNRILKKESLPEDPENLKVFQAAKAFPGRETCATLSWEALEEANKS